MMDYQEAIEALELKGKITIEGNALRVAEFLEGLDTAISAMKKIQQIQHNFIPAETINDLKEFFDRGCEYSGTQEMVDELVSETLKELGSETYCGDEVGLFDFEDNEFSTADEFANLFWDKAIEKILNVFATQELESIL